MLQVVSTGAYYPPVVTAWKIFATGASFLTTGELCNLQSKTASAEGNTNQNDSINVQE